jgi:hypothetical protein
LLSTRVRDTDTAAWRNTGVWFRNDQGRVRVISTRTIKPVRHKSPYLLPPITQRRNPSSRPEPRVLKLPSRKVYWLLLTCSCLSTSYTNTWSKHHTRVAKTITKVIVCPIVYEISQPASRHYRSHRLPPPIIRPYIIWLGGHVVGYWLLTKTNFVEVAPTYSRTKYKTWVIPSARVITTPVKVNAPPCNTGSHRLPPGVVRPYIIWYGGLVVGNWLLS